MRTPVTNTVGRVAAPAECDGGGMIWMSLSRRTRRTRLSVVALAVASIALSACAAPAAAPMPDSELPDDAPVVAFYGDSYTLGTGASDPGKRWSSRIAAERGWREFNPSVNGLGFVARRGPAGADLPTAIIEADPEIVFITMGLNDAYSFAMPGDEVRDQIDADFARLSDALPAARFIVVEPFWYTEAQPDSLRTISEWVRIAAVDIGADYIPGASSWIQGRDPEMAADGLHPNDTGYELMTERMREALAVIEARRPLP